MMNLLHVKSSIKKDDYVVILTGKDKNKTGKVLRVFPKLGKLTVEKLNLVTKHIKRSQQKPKGEIIKKEAPIHHSNVLLFCPKCNRGVRNGRKFIEVSSSSGESEKKQKKVRFCRRCQEILDSI